ncbi:hypothetical protein ACHAWO_009771 [Cyclotella atomus]|uniref:Vacuolar protein-sorting-associated protein 36 n=1 Tax=Cyclotella atomus TaxID=382360 RepID=A0ABD3QC68_9STRA
MANKLQTWSPLTCISPAPLSPSGLITLESPDEVETLVRNNIELRCEGSSPLPRPSSIPPSSSWNAIHDQLTIHITTHRIVLIDESLSIGGSIPLPLVVSSTTVGGPSFRSPKASYKISLLTHAWGELLLVFRGYQNSYTKSQKDRAEAYNSIKRAMQRQAWRNVERSAIKEAFRPSTAIAARKVGVDAIMTRNELRHRENARLAESAFSSVAAAGDPVNSNKNAMMQSTQISGGKKGRVADIDAFMGEAAELIKVIHKYVATIERERTSTAGVGGEGGSDNNTKDTDKLASMLQNMGMTSALSAKQSGSTYHTQLSRQLVDFLKYNNKLSKCGGMMTLTDVYCLFNRARGSNMISPEDLLKAVDIMKELNLGLSKRTFDSGIVVIQEDAFDDESMARQLADLALDSMKLLHRGSGGGITAMDVSRSLKISVLLANEHLMCVEQMGWICRDVTLEGVRFFPNLFVSGDYSSVFRSDAADVTTAAE